jgi:hypothetical protein
MAEHILKCWPNSYDAVALGIKRFEWRKDDRGYEVGDVLVLRKWDLAPGIGGIMTGYVMMPRLYPYHDEYVEQRVRVTYILRGLFRVPEGYCVMSIEPIPETT